MLKTGQHLEHLGILEHLAALDQTWKVSCVSLDQVFIAEAGHLQAFMQPDKCNSREQRQVSKSIQASPSCEMNMFKEESHFSCPYEFLRPFHTVSAYHSKHDWHDMTAASLANQLPQLDFPIASIRSATDCRPQKTRIFCMSCSKYSQESHKSQIISSRCTAFVEILGWRSTTLSWLL